MRGSNSNHDDPDNSSNQSPMFPKIPYILFRLDEVIYDITIRHTSGNTMMKNLAYGTYHDGKKVIMMQISGQASVRAKRKAFEDNLRFCITSPNTDGKNVIQFLGGTSPSDLRPAPFVLFYESNGVDHEEFLRLNKSPKALFNFLDGAEKGNQFIYSNEIKHRDCIKVTPSGEAVIYPSGLLLSKFSGRNSTKRAVRHFLRDVGRSKPALPLQGIYELLSAAKTASQAKTIEHALIETDPDDLNDLALWRLADTLQLPLTRELHYYGPEPGFTLSIGDLGQIEPTPRGESLNEANTLIQFENWCEWRKFPRNSTKWQRQLSSRAIRYQVATPYFLDDRFQPSLDDSNGWLRYDSVMRGLEGDQIDMCLLYATESSRFSAAPDSGLLGEGGPLFTVRSICVRLRFQVPHAALFPKLYFHRRANLDASPREYWGFISDDENPLVTPSYKVQDIKLLYEMQVYPFHYESTKAHSSASNRHIRTSMQGDSWCNRAEGYRDDQINRLPGTFVQ